MKPIKCKNCGEELTVHHYSCPECDTKVPKAIRNKDKIERKEKKKEERRKKRELKKGSYLSKFWQGFAIGFFLVFIVNFGERENELVVLISSFAIGIIFGLIAMGIKKIKTIKKRGKIE